MRSLPLATVLVLAGCHVILPLDQRGPDKTGDAKISAEQPADAPLSDMPLSDVPGQVVDGWPSTVGDAPVREGVMALEGLAPGPCVRTYAQCWRVGQDLAVNEGLWRTADAGYKLLAVMCCK